MGLIEERHIEAAKLAKVATDRIPRCEHVPGGYIAGTTMRMCAKPECRQMIHSNFTAKKVTLEEAKGRG